MITQSEVQDKLSELAHKVLEAHVSGTDEELEAAEAEYAAYAEKYAKRSELVEQVRE